MDSHRFDLITSAFSGRASRRRTLGMAAAAAVGAAVPGARSIAAQDATPLATPGAADGGAAPEFLFVQNATSGTFTANPAAGTPAVSGTPTPFQGADYLLTLNGQVGNTVFFSDRPERIFGSAPTERFLDGIGFTEGNPPNAALVASDADGNEDILVVELFDPSYDEAAGSVTYGVNILSDYEGGLDFVASRQQDEDLAAEFGPASLFIDDCSDADPLNCWHSYHWDPVGNLGRRGMCWDWNRFDCSPCDGGIEGTSAECNAMFPECDNECTTV